MSTKAAIGILEDDGTVRAVLCNYDGYLQGIGKILLSSYTKYDIINQLLAIGNISKLESQPELIQRSKHQNGKSIRFKNIDDFERYFIMADYYYLFDKTFWIWKASLAEKQSYQFLELALNNLK